VNWYYAIEGRSQGPLTDSSLKRLARSGTIEPGTLVWHPGLEEWKPLEELRPELVTPADRSAASLPPDGKTARVAPPDDSGQDGAGVFKRLFGWGRKS
jgi:hypothetical protein